MIRAGLLLIALAVAVVAGVATGAWARPVVGG